MLGQSRADRVIEIGQALAVLGRNRHRIAKTKLISFRRACSRTAFALVRDHDHRLAGAAHDVGEGAIDGSQASAYIDHTARQATRRGLVEPCGIDHGERKIAEARLPFAPVARDARPVIDERQPSADQPVEQGRLADIRPADDREGEAHDRLRLRAACEMRALIAEPSGISAGVRSKVPAREARSSARSAARPA